MVSRSVRTSHTSHSNKVAREYDSSFDSVEETEIDHQNNNKKANPKSNKKQKSTGDSQNKNTLTSTNNVLSDKTNTVSISHPSQVWQYALRDCNTNFAICCLCPDKKRISTNNGSTSTLRRHLVSKHDKHELILPSNKRKTTKSSVDIMKKQKLHRLIVNCIIGDGRTFNDFEKPGMKNLFQELVPGYEPPNRHQVVYRLKRLYVQHHKKLIDYLTSIDHISITLDFWSNRQKRCFLVITGHYFEKNNYDLKSTVLNFSKFDAQHTAIEISRVLETKLKELHILQKVVCVTSDGAPNMVRGIDDMNLNLKRVWCVAHRLHLTIINAFGFWVMKKEGEASTMVEGKEHMNHETIDQEEAEMTSIEDFQDDDTMDTDDSELDDIESTDIDYFNNEEEELLSDVVDEEIIDNWSEGIILSDDDIGDDQEMINCVLQKCRALISMIKCSTIITVIFDVERKKCNVKRNLCYDVKSRWNSTFIMIDSVLALRTVLENLFIYKHQLRIRPKQIRKLTGLELTNDDWTVLLTLHFILKPFFHATKAMSGRQYPSIGLAFYLLIRLKHFLQRHEQKEGLILKRFKQLLLAQLLHYFESDHEQIQLLKLHAYFDPAGFATLTDQEKRSVEQNIKMMVVDETFQPTEPATTTSSIITGIANTSKNFNLYEKSNKSALDMFTEAIGESSYEESADNKNKKATIIDDIHNYRNYATRFNLKHKPSATSSTLFWQTYGDNLSTLGKIAKIMLSSPATSVPSESCFSVSAYLGRKERARLTGENLSSSVFLKDKINFSNQPDCL